MKQEIIDKELLHKQITSTFNMRNNVLKAKKKREGGEQSWGEYFFGYGKLKDVQVPQGEQSKGEQLYNARSKLLLDIERTKYRDELEKNRLLGLTGEGNYGLLKVGLAEMFEK